MAGESQPDQPPQPIIPAGEATNAPEFVREFFQVQLKDIEVRSEQIRLDHSKVEHGSKYALAALEKQSQYLSQEGTNHHSRQVMGMVVVGILALAILIFLAIVILNNHEQIALELVKLVGYGGVGGAGGYGLGRLRSSKGDASSEQSSKNDPAEE